MNTPIALQQSVQSAQSRPEGAGKYRLNPLHSEHTTPYIEHWVVQLHGVAPEQIDDAIALRDALVQAVEDLELTHVSDHSHYFGPGVSTVVILSESHLSAHTWPETGYVHLDVVTCVEKLTPEALRRVMQAQFAPQRIQLDQLIY